jgi:hypothetical protein
MGQQRKHGFVKRLALPLAVAALAAPAAQATNLAPNHPPKSDSESPVLFHQLRRSAPDGQAPTVYTTSPISATAATGTDWVDRGFGIGAALGVVVVGGGLVVTARKARREATA